MVFGWYHQGVLHASWRMSSHRELTSDELAWQLDGLFARHQPVRSDLDGMMVASVVPHLNQVLEDACRQLTDAEIAFIGDADVKTGMALDYKNPREVGADRIANAVAAREKYGAPVVVLDCGTATTFDVVTPNGHYAGGLIIPGMEVSLLALSKRAARLPEVSFEPTDLLIGRDTISSMQAGVYWSNVEGLSGITRRLKAMDECQDATVIATGGFAGLISRDMDCIDHVEPNLTLDGLLLMAQRHFQ